MIKEEIKGNYIYLNYFIKQEKVGFIELQKNFEILDITMLEVKEEYRRQKIASILIEEAIKKYKDIEKIMLEVKIDNIAAINLYKKYDFKVIHERKNYYKTTSALIMERII